jgi:signal transduction histidine kinase
VVGVLGTIAAIALATAILANELPPPVSPIDPSEDNGVPLSAHPGMVAMYAVALAAYAGAAVGFARRAERTGDPLMGWLAAGMVLAGFARLNYALFPTAYSAWVYTGDILRICSSLALFAGLAAEVARYERGMARAAVLDDRRRIARDLHDGLAQELSFIANESRRARRAPGVPERESAVLDRIATAAQRALDESRDAILALSRDDDEPLDAALARAAEDVAGRMGGDVRLELDPRAELAPAARDALVRIVREAMTNAFRHGRASAVEVTLSVGSGIRLEVSDDGAGFDPAAEERGGGFGLTSMRERAEALGGELLVMSRPGEGARVEVVLP